MIEETLENLKSKDYWNICVKYFSSIRFPTLVHYLQYHKNDSSFNDIKKATLEDLQWLEDFCKKDKHERNSVIYKWTCVQKYGEDYFKEHAAKVGKVKEQKYGEDYNKIFMQKAKENGLKKDPDMIAHNNAKRHQTLISKYGKDYLSKRGKEASKASVKSRKAKGKEFWQSVYSKSAATKMQRYGTLFPRCSQRVSIFEKDVLQFIKENYQGEIIENSRTILKDVYKELDIYIPEKNLAIECDGWFYHSEANRMNRFYIDGYSPDIREKLANHRLEKTDLCEAQGIRLIHILDLYWSNPIKQQIYKSLILSALGVYQHKYFARKLQFKELDSKTARDFLDKNHLQGAAKATKYFALLDEKDNPIQVMSFQLHSNHSYGECELNRMATSLNAQVVGGFSKLLKNALDALQIESCTSYIDRTIFNGNSYREIGFKELHKVAPVYFYIYKNQVYRREFGMKRNIQKLFEAGELEYWNPNETEQENMIKNRIPRIWDCGKVKVEYRKS